MLEINQYDYFIVQYVYVQLNSIELCIKTCVIYITHT